MANTLITKNSSTAAAIPTAGQLVQGELAVNVTDKRIFTENSGGTVVELGTNPSALNFADNAKANFGAGSDLQIYHDPAGGSYISDQGGGNLKILASDRIQFFNADESELYAQFIVDGKTSIYFNGVETLATTATGVDVTGTVVADGLTVDGNVGIGTSSPAYKLTVQSGSTTILAGADSSANTLTDATQKVMRFGVPHYTNAEEPVGALFGSNTSTENNVFIGGGSGFFNAATLVSFYTAANTTTQTGSERMRITSAGNVGIGTSSPVTKLDVNGGFAVSGSVSGFAGGEVRLGTSTANLDNAVSTISTGTPTMFFDHRGTGTGKWVWRSASSERMTLDGAGNLGIGTSSPATGLHLQHNTAGATSGTIRIQDTDEQQSPDQQTGGIEFYTQDGTTPTEGVSTAIKSFSASTQGGGYLTLSTTDIATSTLDERVRITSAGNVGIGTSSPTTKLTVLTGTNAGISVNDGTVNTILYNTSNANGTLGTTTNHPMAFYANDAERMRIDSSGNLLVGKTSVTTVGNGVFFRVGNYSSITVGSFPCLVLNRETSTGHIQDFRYNNTEVGSISVTASATAYNTSSDYRLKEDWVAVADASTRINALKPINFAWKADGSRVDGFLAHELAEVVPEAVTGTKDAVDANGEPEYQGIDQSKLVPLLTAALQEALAKIESLEARLDAANI